MNNSYQIRLVYKKIYFDNIIKHKLANPFSPQILLQNALTNEANIRGKSAIEDEPHYLHIPLPVLLSKFHISFPKTILVQCELNFYLNLRSLYRVSQKPLSQSKGTTELF